MAYRGVWLAGLGSVPNPTFLSRAQLTLNMAHRPDWLVIVAAFGFITVCLLLLSMISTLGEELGWRGFLVPELTQWIGTERAALTSGVIWCELAFSRTSLVRLWRDWHSADLPDRLFFADGGRIGSCDGMAENQVGQHLARSGHACGTHLRRSRCSSTALRHTQLAQPISQGNLESHWSFLRLS